MTDQIELYPHLIHQRSNSVTGLVRSTDPITSTWAAESVVPKLSKIQAEVMEYAKFRGDEGFTDFELQSYFGNHLSTYRTRRAELLHKGLLEDTGRVRCKPGSNRRFVVWAIKDVDRG